MGNKNAKPENAVFTKDCIELKMKCSVPMLDETEINFYFDKHKKMGLIIIDYLKSVSPSSTSKLKLKSFNIVYDIENNTYAKYYIDERGEMKIGEPDGDENATFYFIMVSWIPLFEMINNFSDSKLSELIDNESKTSDCKYEANSKRFNNLTYFYLIKNKRVIEFMQEKKIDAGMTAFLVSLILEEKELNEKESSNLFMSIPNKGLIYEKFQSRDS